jgi:hypothetical protein
MSNSQNKTIRVIAISSVAYAVLMGLTTIAQADGIAVPRAGAAVCNPIRLACENARSYGLCPIGVTDVGELVTGTLTSPGPHYVREIPMRDGYRYAGRGIWFDGKGTAGRLFFGPTRSVACIVEY